MCRIFSLVVLVLACLVQTGFSQKSFSEVKLTITGNRVLGGNTLLKSWEPSSGIGLEIATPYYFGNLETGIRYFRFDELEFEGSGFHSGFLFVGWNYTYYASEGEDLSIVPGIRLGNRFLIHDEDKIYRDEYRFNNTESEFAFELQFRIQYRINKNFEFYTAAAYNRTLFHIPFAEWLGTAGISFVFGTSESIQNFLK